MNDCINLYSLLNLKNLFILCVQFGSKEMFIPSPSVSRDNDTALPYWCESGGVIRTYQVYYQLYLLKLKKLVNSNNNRSKSEVSFSSRMSSVSDWLLNIFCLKLILNLKIWIILTQFYINFSRQEHQIELL